MGMVLKLFSESSNEIEKLFQNHPLRATKLPSSPSRGNKIKIQGMEKGWNWKDACTLNLN